MHWDPEPTPHPSQEGNGQEENEYLLSSRERLGVGRFMGKAGVTGKKI